MNRDVAPFPPPLGRHQPYAYDGPPARKPARVPLWAAGFAALATLVVSQHVGSLEQSSDSALFGDLSGVAQSIATLVVLVYGLGVVAALLVVAGLAKLAGSRAVGILGTLIVLVLFGIYVTSG